MSKDKREVKTVKRSERLGGAQVLVISSLFVALSIILGKYLSFTAGPFRISFENLTILMAGIFFGPVVGLLVGACADLVGCLLVGYAINPIVTAGGAAVGLLSGVVYRLCTRLEIKTRLAAAVGTAHVIGSMIIKSIGLYVYFNYPLPLIFLRIPLYIVIGLAEGYIIYLLLNNKAFKRQVEGMKIR